jgi:5-methylcytosine-specific restriction endonuclease McrA
VLDNKRIKHARVHRSIPRALRQKLMASAGCHYCSGPVHVIDHVIPVSRGGTRLEHNLVPACEWCNSQKSDMFVDEWLEWRVCNRWPWPPRGDRDDWLYKLRLID